MRVELEALSAEWHSEVEAAARPQDSRKRFHGLERGGWIHRVAISSQAKMLDRMQTREAFDARIWYLRKRRRIVLNKCQSLEWGGKRTDVNHRDWHEAQQVRHESVNPRTDVQVDQWSGAIYLSSGPQVLIEIVPAFGEASCGVPPITETGIDARPLKGELISALSPLLAPPLDCGADIAWEARHGGCEPARFDAKCCRDVVRHSQRCSITTRNVSAGHRLLCCQEPADSRCREAGSARLIKADAACKWHVGQTNAARPPDGTTSLILSARSDRPDKNLQIQTQGPGADVFEIHSDPIIESRDLMAASHLP